MKSPIIILGFGRSGTTWISDIISKSLGGLVLFEPLHPEVYKDSKEACYHNGTDLEKVGKLFSHLDACLEGNIRDKWLLRNHVSNSLEEVSDSFIKSVWDNCSVIGFKAIRANFLIPELCARYDAKIVYIKRNPIAVASSLVNRERFWMEYGYEFHEAQFFAQVIASGKYSYLDAEALTDLYKGLDKMYLKMVFLWAVTHVVVSREMTKLGLPIFDYEDFYTQPFETTKKLCTYLGKPDITLHPSYLFTPSMLTLKTFHEYSTEDEITSVENLRVFWSKNFNRDQEDEITNLVNRINTM